eukprot:TRINITY_DN1521_c0_g1_i1.p1 TRINITY_DN1521_c0_g1~~TRINITY_DN1521_c0_g1_i1.p1  ORF type:complete len:402 (+),score=136.36 TRINITY_DN1521_c0_g1_i1:42-1208(+)
MDDRMEEEVDEIELPNSEVVIKYNAAADIANRALAAVVKEAVAGRKIVDLCAGGDKVINEGVAATYGRLKDKGVAFPTCVSVNNCVGHFSPLSSDTSVLNDGDLVKIDLGVHIDGFIATVAHTMVVTANASVPIVGKQADVICAAHFAGEIAHRLIKPGNKNTQVTEAINQVAAQYKVNVVEGVLSHQMKRFVIDGNNIIISKSSLEHKVDEFEFQENQCYSVDIVMSTGEGKTKDLGEQKTTIYKRSVDQNYLLKMKASRYVFNEINTRFPTLPFTLRALDESKARLGITELLSHDLVSPYPVLYEKEGEFVAQFKFTVIISSSETKRLTSHPLPYVNSNLKIEDTGLNQILATGTKRTKKNSNKKKKANKPKSDAAAAPSEAMDTN